VKIDGYCPECDAEVEFDQFGDEFPCLNCAALLSPEHECYYDDESGDAWCSDYLALAVRG
jgi:hypothetical protein